MSQPHKILGLLLACGLVLIGLLNFYEWYRVGVVASPEVLAQYPFGAEGPPAAYPAYASASAYASDALHTWLFAVVLLLVLVIGVVARSSKLLFGCYAVFLLAIAGRAAGAL